MHLTVNIIPLVEKFEKPYYPVEVSIVDNDTNTLYEGVIIYHFDRKFGKFLVNDADIKFKNFIKNIQKTSNWGKISEDIATVVFSTDEFKEKE